MSLRQAVILAGGSGERLMPFTLQTPKPLMSINGKPFITFLLDRLFDQGILEILILTGYRASQFDFLQDQYNEIGKSVITVQSPQNFETGARVRHCATRLDDEFILLYGDNYWPFDLGNMYREFVQAKVKGQIVAYRNIDNYSRSNLELDEGGNVKTYDKSRQANGLDHVDIGFGIFAKSAISALPDDGNPNFEQHVYPTLVEDGNLHAYCTSHRYYSLTNPERLNPLQKALSNQKYLFLDRDGVLNKKAGRGEYVSEWSHWHWNTGAKKLLRLLKKNNIRVVVITNQAGIGRDMFSQPAMDCLHHRVREETKKFGGDVIEHFYVCPHHWEDNCDCRKPKPGLFYMAQRDFHIDLSTCTFVGDASTDEEAAKAANLNFILVKEGENVHDVVSKMLPGFAG